MRVRARYYQGEHADSPWSGPWKEITGQVTQPQGVLSVPATPNLTGTLLTPEGEVMLVWQNPSDDSITGYQVLRAPGRRQSCRHRRRHRVERYQLHGHIPSHGPDPYIRREGAKRHWLEPAIQHGHGNRAETRT